LRLGPFHLPRGEAPQVEVEPVQRPVARELALVLSLLRRHSIPADGATLSDARSAPCPIRIVTGQRPGLEGAACVSTTEHLIRHRCPPADSVSYQRRKDTTPRRMPRASCAGRRSGGGVGPRGGGPSALEFQRRDDPLALGVLVPARRDVRTWLGERWADGA